MPTFTKDSIFVFTNRELDYRWKLISGSVFEDDVRDEFEMPGFCLFGNELEIECGFDKDIPFGLKLANSTKLEFNMNAFKENDLDIVWDLIRDNSNSENGLFWESKDTFQYLIKPDFKLLNCWVFEKFNSGTNKWDIIDIFTQDDKQVKTKVSKGKFKFEIELSSLWKTISEKVVFQFFNMDWYYKSENYKMPSFRAFCGLPENHLSDDQLDFSSRRKSLQVGNKNLKYWGVLNTHQVAIRDDKHYTKRSYWVQDVKSDKRSENGRIHLRLIRADRVFHTMSYAFVQLFKLYTRGKLFTNEITSAIRIPNPLNFFKFFKYAFTEDITWNGVPHWGDEIANNELYLTEGLYEAVNDGEVGLRWLNARCNTLQNPLYSKYKNLWDFMSEFYQSYPVTVRFNANKCNFEMNSLFDNTPVANISSAYLDSETLEYEKFNSEFNSYELVCNCSGSNPSNRIIFEQSGESESGQTKYIAQHIFNNFRNKLTEPYHWKDNNTQAWVEEFKTQITFDNISNFQVGLLVTPHSDWSFHDGNEKQVFASVGNHFIFTPMPTFQPVWYPTGESAYADTEGKMNQYLQRTNLNGFSAFCQTLMSEFLLNTGKSAILTFKSKFYEAFDVNDVGAPMQIYINQLFRDLLDLNITDLPDAGIMCAIGSIKKDYIKRENEIKLFIRGGM